MTSAGAIAPQRGRVAGLDLIRGVAIGLVLLRHAWPDVFGSAGVAGVVAFFALSGYLITGILSADIRKRGRVSYGRFYRNRLLRLYPPLIVMLIGFTLVTVIWNPLGDRQGLWRAILTGLTYTGNIPYDHGSPAVSHLWTLATEEQFYLVWPVILTIALRRKRLALAVVLSTSVVALAMFASMIVTAPGIYRIYGLPSSWAIAMIIGAAAKLWEPQVRSSMSWMLSPSRGGLAAVTVLLLMSTLPEQKNSPWTYIAVGPAVAIVTVVLVLSWSAWTQLPSAALRPLLALGTVSYAAYLWNYPIVLWMGERPLPWYAAVGSVVLTIGAATASWWLVERPLQEWRKRLDARAARAARPATRDPSIVSASRDLGMK